MDDDVVRPGDEDRTRRLEQLQIVLAELVREKFPPDAQEQLKQELDLRTRLHEETDRGCALVGAAYLDDAIEELLRSRMVQRRENISALLDQGQPLGTFSSRIRVAFAMGLLHENTFHDLKIVRGIRNKFAHVHGPVSFDERAITDQCNSLKSVLPILAGVRGRKRFIHVITTAYSAIVIEARNPAFEPSDGKEFWAQLQRVSDALTDALGGALKRDS